MPELLIVPLTIHKILLLNYEEDFSGRANQSLSMMIFSMKQFQNLLLANVFKF